MWQSANKPVTWQRALEMCEEIEDGRRPMPKWEAGIVNQCYGYALGKHNIPPLLAVRLEDIYFKRERGPWH